MTVKTITLFGIPNCDQVKKARTWLDANDITFVFHDFKKSGIRTEYIEVWLKDLAWDVLVNRKGTTWRALTPEHKATVTDAQSAIELMLQSPSIVKRPVLCVVDEQGKSHCNAGFSDELYRNIFQT